jgi:SulP family sulfate permease
MIVALRRWKPALPGMLIAIAAAAAAVALLDLPVATIGSAFGDLARGLPAPQIPALSWDRVVAVLPDAIAFTLLGAIESLLSAAVADGMTGRRHRSNTELIGQGIANIGASLFGGFCVTGTIARTATNARAGAHGPVAGMIHALALLAFLIFLAPLASLIPLAALAGVLVTVAWHMLEPRAILALARISRAEAGVLAVTLLLTVLRDLTEAIVVGVALGSLIFMQRMARSAAVTSESATDETQGMPEAVPDPERVELRLSGAYFFGSAPRFDSVLDRIAARPQHVLLDFSGVLLMDSSGAHSIAAMIRRLTGQGRQVRLTGIRPELAPILSQALHEAGQDGRVDWDGAAGG